MANVNDAIAITANFGGSLKTLTWEPGVYSLTNFQDRDTISSIKALKNVNIQLYNLGKLDGVYNLKKDQELKQIGIDIQRAEVMIISTSNVGNILYIGAGLAIAYMALN